MKRLAVLSSLSLSVLLAAGCGGAADPAPAAPAAGPVHAEGHEGHHQGHAAMPPAVVAFHDVLRPLWHDESPERMTRACAGVGELRAKAEGLATVEVEAAKKDAWASGTTSLTASLEEFATACGTDAAGAQPAFAKLHDGFHGLLGLAGGGEGHGEGNCQGDCCKGKKGEGHDKGHGHGHGHGEGHGHGHDKGHGHGGH